MSIYITVSDLRQYLYQPGDDMSAETDALFQAVADRSEALIARYLTGVVIPLPAPEDLKQVCLEKAADIYITRGTPSLQASVGIDGQGAFDQITYLTSGQRAALRQIRIELGGLAV